MDSIEIEGGVPLEGVVPISGAKNAALPMMVAGLLTADPLTLQHVPELADVALMNQILRGLGVDVIQHETGVEDGCGHDYTFHAAQITNTQASYELVSRMRASFWVIAPLLARCGEASVALPGGCAIGARPVDFYLHALEKMGVQIENNRGYIVARAPKGLIGGQILFPRVTVGATHTLLMAATLARGETIIENAACEPEVCALAYCLNKMGAQISGIGTSRLVIQGVERLHGATHEIPPDRIEMGTYALAAIATGGEVLLEKAHLETLGIVPDALLRAGAEVVATDDGVRVSRKGKSIEPVDVETAPFPGFPTDLQAQWMALMSLARGTSVIHETIFENRFMHVQELVRLGADVSLEGDRAIVRGVAKLQGAQVMATDLRASACLVVAGLAAEGVTNVSRVYHLDRGFELLEQKLTHVGARIRRVKS